jgi:mannose-6-phosphate isomerase-like protein (cupin superfamily)
VYAIRLCALNHTSRPEDVEWVLDWFAGADTPELAPRAPRPGRSATLADAHATRSGPFEPEDIVSLPLFEELSEAQARRVAETAREIAAAPGDAVIMRHQLERDFYVIVAGAAAVEIDGAHIRDLRAGDFFGELAALGWGAGFGYARSATVTATAPLRLLVLAPRDLHELMRAAPAVARRVQAAARERLRRT